MKHTLIFRLSVFLLCIAWAGALSPLHAAPECLYLIGNYASAKGEFNADKGLEMTRISDWRFSITTSFLSADNTPTFGISTTLGSSADDWGGLNAGRLGPAAADENGFQGMAEGGVAELSDYTDYNNSFVLSNATYTITADLGEMTLTVEKNDVSLAGEVADHSWNPERGHGMKPLGDNLHVASVRLSGGGYYTLAEDFGAWDTQFNPSRLGPLYGDTSVDESANAHHPFSSDLRGAVLNIASAVSGKALALSCDKARYAPGETVVFTADGLPEGACVRYRHLSDVVAEHPLEARSWTWTAPQDNYKGYLIDVYSRDGEGRETIHGSIAVDVSSDWTRFPRYGFVANFDRYLPGSPEEAEHERIEREVEFLNRCHINGVQFQDWHWKHHWPVAVNEDGTLKDWYQDIAKHWVSRDFVNRYIDAQHKRNMKSIFYNLAFGALANPQEEVNETTAEQDGVKEEWYCYRSPGDHSDANIDKHVLREWGKSDIYLVNPGNPEWQEYLGRQNDMVYSNFNFDGYQIDQLGDRGRLYAYDGDFIDLGYNYRFFIDAMKNRHPDKTLVMNSVSRYGAESIAGSGKVDFCYNEVWGKKDDGSDDFNSREHRFAELLEIIHENDRFSDSSLRTVFAAYMNYKKADSQGYFNTPGIILTDAAIFAIGGTHLELGVNHMLGKEYFPNSNLMMSDELTDAMIRYYDFATAYENLLMTPSSHEIAINVAGAAGHTLDCGGRTLPVRFAPWTVNDGPKPGHIVTYSKRIGNRTLVNFLNFMNVDRLSWRDAEGTMPEPAEASGLELFVECAHKVSRAWVASPDSLSGVPVEIPFAQDGSAVKLTLPALKYWTMLVLE